MAQARTATCVVTFHRDGSISVAEDGRGTDTRTDQHGVAVREPVAATLDFPDLSIEVVVE